MPKIAIFTLTRERLEYTKRCLNNLREKAGMDYFHLVIDNGSRDGTVEWLKSQLNVTINHVIFNDTNKGLHRANNQALDYLLPMGFEFIIKFDNDCFIHTDKFLKIFLDAVEAFKNARAFFNPSIFGKRTTPKATSFFQLGTFSFERVPTLDGMCLLTPSSFYIAHKFRYDESFPLAKSDDSYISRFASSKGYELVRVKDVAVEHIDTTMGQEKKFPEYFDRKRIEETLVPGPSESTDLVSIVIPTYNCGKWLSECIESFLQQTHENIEIIVVDDGSTDDTTSVLDKYRSHSKIRILKHNHNRGANAARNTGLEVASGEFVLFADADSKAYPHMIQEMLDFLRKNEYASYVYCNFDLVKENGEKITFKSTPFSCEKLRKRNFISMVSLIRRKDMVAFDPNVKRLQDWDLWITLAEQKKFGVFLEKTLFLSYIRPEGISGSKNSFSSREAASFVRGKHKNFFTEKKSRSITAYNPYTPNTHNIARGRSSISPLRHSHNSPFSPQKISVVVFSEGKLNYLNACLNSINAQKSTVNLEVIVAYYGIPYKGNSFSTTTPHKTLFRYTHPLYRVFNDVHSLIEGEYTLLLQESVVLSKVAIKELRSMLFDENSVSTSSIRFPNNEIFSLQFSSEEAATNKIPFYCMLPTRLLPALPEISDKAIHAAFWLSLLNRPPKVCVNVSSTPFFTAFLPPQELKTLPKILQNLENVINEPPLVQKVEPVLETSFMKGGFYETIKRPTVDIIVCTHNNSDFTIECFESVRKYTTNYKLYWVDNNSSPEERVRVSSFLAKNEIPFVPILNDVNLGFVKGCNQALKSSSSPLTVILNNDTRVTPGWVDKMFMVFLRHRDAGIVGPVTSAGGYQTLDILFTRYPKIFKKRVLFNELNELAVNDFLEKNYSGIYLKVEHMLAFFCTLFKREVFDKIGFLDERFGMGFGDDNDFCLHAQKRGYELYIACDTYILHHQRTTFKKVFPGYKKMMEENLRKFKEKWHLK